MPSTSSMSSHLPALRVSDNGRFLVRQDGAPFFWLGDTAWELYHRLDRADAIRYLDNRAEHGFNVVQAVALAELDGLRTPNAQGDLPFVDNDPTRPVSAYWEHVDYIVDQAAERGIYTAMLPAWGCWVVEENRLTTENAQSYGEFLGKRYADRSIIWVLGGDRPANGYEAVWRALARGIAIGVSGSEDYDATLMTYHPRGLQSSSYWFHDEPWLDFNMRQTGHCRDSDAAKQIFDDYQLSPTKPVIDGEPLYESHPGFCDTQDGYSDAYDVRKMAWWDVFAGAFGHTYGNHNIWQMYEPGRAGVTEPLAYWHDAIHEPGGTQLRHLRALVESRPFLTRVPDQGLLVSDPGTGGDLVRATRGSEGHYAFVYSASGQPFTVDLGRLSGTELRTTWYDPRTGAATDNGTVPNDGPCDFTPPTTGEDWTLVVDDTEQHFPTPGRPRE